MKKFGLEYDVERVMIEESALRTKVRELALKLEMDYKDKNPIFVCVLKGSVNFFSDLIREFHDYCDLDFISVSSYGNGTESTGHIRINKDLDMCITGRHVIVVEDIMDSGNTLNHLTAILRERNPKSLKLITLLDKPERRQCTIFPDYYGFVIPDEFVVGYGLDYAEAYRNLPYIGVLKKEVYEEE